MYEQQVEPFSSPWLNKLLAEAFGRPALDGAEDALVLKRVFLSDSHPSLEGHAVIDSSWASEWLRRAVSAGLKRSSLHVARDVQEFADYMVEVVRVLARHGYLQGNEDRRRMNALLAQANETRQYRPSVAVAAKRLRAAAESPDAGRSLAIAEASKPAHRNDPLISVLLGLATAPVSERRARLRGMASLLGSTAQRPLHG